MYTEITSNKRRTIVLMVLFVVLIVGAGYGFGYWYSDPYFGMTLAILIALFMTIGGYFKGDAVALSTSGAQVIEKADDPKLWNVIETLSIAAGLPMPRVAIIEDPALNAFAAGRDPEHAVVAVTRGLLDKLTRVELEGVIAHEMSHIGNYDIRLMTVVVVLIGTLALLSDLFRFSLWGGSKRSGKGGGGGWLAVVGIVLLILSPLIGQLIKLAVSRQREYLADASGALLTRYPEGLASALEKISGDTHKLKRANHAVAHMFISDPFKKPGMLQRAFATHPPAGERIKRLRGM